MRDLPKIYEVYIKEDSEEPLETAEFVQDGFNFFAAFVTFFWAIYKGIWWLAVFVPLYNILLMLAVQKEFINPNVAALFQLGFMIVAGFAGNDWFAASLKRKNYKLKEIVAARNLTEAQHRFFGAAVVEKPIATRSIYSTL